MSTNRLIAKKYCGGYTAGYGGRDYECSETRGFQCDGCRIVNLMDAVETLVIQIEHGLDVENEIHERCETDLPSWLNEAAQIVTEIRSREII